MSLVKCDKMYHFTRTLLSSTTSITPLILFHNQSIIPTFQVKSTDLYLGSTADIGHLSGSTII